MNKIDNESEDITTDLPEIMMTVRDYDQWYPNKLNDSDERDKILDPQKLPKLNREEIGHLNRAIKRLNGNVPTKTSLDQMPSMVNPTKHLKKLTPILLELLQNTEDEGALPNSFHGTRIMVMPSPRQRHHKKKKR